MGICSSKNRDSKKIAHENGLKLIQACAEDDRDKILELLGEEFIDVNARAGLRGYTPLHVVQSPEVAKILIKSGAKVNKKDDLGDSPLHVASSELVKHLITKNFTNKCSATPESQANLARILIENGAKVNVKTNSGDTPLHFADSIDIVEALIEARAKVNIKNGSGDTPLHFADSIDIVEALIEAGAKVNVKNGSGDTPLHRASSRAIVEKLVSLGLDVNNQGSFGNTPFLSAKSAEAQLALLEAGMDINLKGGAFENSPLHEAQSPEVVRKLVALGADLETKNFCDETPLQHACSIEIAQTLIDCGAEIHPPSYSLFGCEGETRNFLLQKVEEMKTENGSKLIQACKHQDEEASLELLKEEFIDVTVKDARDITPLHFAKTAEIARTLLERGADNSAQDKEGNTPLHFAVKENNLEVAQLLLEKYGAAVDATDKEGMTPLYSAQSPEMVEILVDNGANVNAKVDYYGPQGALNQFVLVPCQLNNPYFHYYDTDILDVPIRMYYYHYDKKTTPLHFAKTAEVALALIERGADINAQDKEGNTPLYFAVKDNNLEVAQLLLEKHGAAVDAKNINGWTALHYATIGNNNLDMIKLLLEHGADINARNTMDETPLYLATANSGMTPLYLATSDAVQLVLIEAGANVNAKNNPCPIQDMINVQRGIFNMRPKGTTPLHLAKSIAVIEALLARGADVNVVNSRGETPLSLAKSIEIKEKLQEAGAIEIADSRNTEVQPGFEPKMINAILPLILWQIKIDRSYMPFTYDEGMENEIKERGFSAFTDFLRNNSSPLYRHATIDIKSKYDQDRDNYELFNNYNKLPQEAVPILSMIKQWFIQHKDVLSGIEDYLITASDIQDIEKAFLSATNFHDDFDPVNYYIENILQHEALIELLAKLDLGSVRQHSTQEFDESAQKYLKDLETIVKEYQKNSCNTVLEETDTDNEYEMLTIAGESIFNEISDL